MRHNGIPDKFISIIKNTYSGMQSKIIHEGKLTEPFAITILGETGLLTVTSAIPFSCRLDNETSYQQQKERNTVDAA